MAKISTDSIIPHIYYENLMGAHHFNPASFENTTENIVLEAPNPLPGYQFIGWFDAPVNGNQILMLLQGGPGDFYLYARWNAVCCTISYSGNVLCGFPAHCIPHSRQALGGESILLSKRKPIRRHCRFAGWNTRPDGSGTTYQPGALICNIVEDICLYAQWNQSLHTSHTAL